uniref:G-protein coupled receptors family 1 profile domain-containing protein n=1 Tax=Macaca nemestrina TaxID=9545 RepID=A0A2K6D6R5_MACNE
MLKLNGTVFMPSVLMLIEIPGLESVQFWIGIPFCAMYIIAVFGNSLPLVIIKAERSLHEPMYVFLAMLGATDIALSTCILPKMLGIFWFHPPQIYFDACLLQMWFIHSFQCIDCYVAICDPLRHAVIFTHQFLTQIGVGVTLRAALFAAPCVILLKCRLKFYRTTVVLHSYCEHMSIVKLAADDMDGLFVAFSILGLDEARFKAFNTCIVHICVFLVFHLLGFFSFFTHRFGFHIPSYIHILLSNIYLLVPPLLNPIVYGVKTKQIRDGVSKIFYSKNPS